VERIYTGGQGPVWAVVNTLMNLQFNNRQGAL
jgi:hypothetical protein